MATTPLSLTPSDSRPSAGSLSHREREVFKLLAQGLKGGRRSPTGSCSPRRRCVPTCITEANDSGPELACMRSRSRSKAAERAADKARDVHLRDADSGSDLRRCDRADTRRDFAFYVPRWHRGRWATRKCSSAELRRAQEGSESAKATRGSSGARQVRRKQPQRLSDRHRAPTRLSLERPWRSNRSRAPVWLKASPAR